MRIVAVLPMILLAGCGTTLDPKTMSDRLNAEITVAKQRGDAGDWPAAEQAMNRSFRIANTDILRVQVALNGAVLGLRKQDRTLGLAWVKRALLIADRIGSDRFAGDALRLKGDLKSQTGDESGGAAAYIEAARRYALAKRPLDEAMSEEYAGQSLLAAGDIDGRDHYWRAATLFEANGQPDRAADIRVDVPRRLTFVDRNYGCTSADSPITDGRRASRASPDGRNPVATLCLAGALARNGFAREARTMLVEQARRGAAGEFCDDFRAAIDRFSATTNDSMLAARATDRCID